MAKKSPIPKPPAGSWIWRSADQRLLIDAPKDSDVSDLSGEWTLDALAKMLEGLSRGRLDDALGANEGAVRCALNLSNGRVVHLAGAFLEPGEARGILLRDEVLSEEDYDERPGPDLKPYFQPIISLRTGAIAGFEALARWEGEGGDRVPQRFEDAGLATNMLIQSAEVLSHFREVSRRDDLFMHVNVTARDLAQSTTPNLVEALMLGHDLPEKALRIELTEQAALRDRDEALSAAKALKHVGAGLVLDDFGSGHSSFSWLSELPADSLKIDAELTRRLGEPRTDTILQTVTLLAERLNMQATAEGVEHTDDAARLRALGFDFVQGYAFGRPMGAKAAELHLKGWL